METVHSIRIGIIRSKPVPDFVGQGEGRYLRRDPVTGVHLI